HEEEIIIERKRGGEGGGGRWVMDGDDGKHVIVIELDGDMQNLHEHLMQRLHRHNVKLHDLDLHGVHELDHVIELDRHGDGPHGIMKLRVGDGHDGDIDIDVEGLPGMLDGKMGHLHEMLERELGEENLEHLHELLSEKLHDAMGEHGGDIEKVIREKLHDAMGEHGGDIEKVIRERLHDAMGEHGGDIEKVIRERLHEALGGMHGPDGEEFEVHIEVLAEDDDSDGPRPQIRRRVMRRGAGDVQRGERERERERNVVIERRREDRPESRPQRERVRVRRPAGGEGDQADRLERRIERLERRIEELIKRLERMDR
ncbi:MAG: hypothetical protein ACYTGG_06020, partial [Planctomycetota bacterium]